MTPLVSSRELRPGRAGYVVAGAVVLLCILGGVGAFVFGIGRAVVAFPELDRTFDAGVPTAVTLTADPEKVLFADRDLAGSDCSVTGGPGEATFRGISYSFEFSADGKQWHAVNRFAVSAAGTYTVTCAPRDRGAAGPVRFAVGDAPDLGGYFGGLFGGIAALAGLPCLGVVVGGTIALITAVRRSSTKKRLLAERTPRYPPPAYPPPGG